MGLLVIGIIVTIVLIVCLAGYMGWSLYSKARANAECKHNLKIIKDIFKDSSNVILSDTISDEIYTLRVMTQDHDELHIKRTTKSNGDRFFDFTFLRSGLEFTISGEDDDGIFLKIFTSKSYNYNYNLNPEDVYKDEKSFMTLWSSSHEKTRILLLFMLMAFDVPHRFAYLVANKTKNEIRAGHIIFHKKYASIVKQCMVALKLQS